MSKWRPLSFVATASETTFRKPPESSSGRQRLGAATLQLHTSAEVRTTKSRVQKSVEAQTQAQSPKSTGSSNGLSFWHRRASDLPTTSDHLQARFEVLSMNRVPRII